MTPLRHRALLVAAVGIPMQLVFVVVATEVGATDQPRQTAGSPLEVSLSSPAPVIGTEVTIVLKGWPDVIATVALCGNEARRGSVDCNQTTAVSTRIPSDQVAEVQLLVTEPAAPCPCVLRISDHYLTHLHLEPIDIPDAPTAPVVDDDAATTGRLEVDAEVVTADGLLDRLRSSLAGPTAPVLEVTVRNTSAYPVGEIAITAASGRDGAAGRALDAMTGLSLAPSEQRTFTFRVRFDAPSYGTYHVRGEVVSAWDRDAFDVTASTTPYGLVVLAALAAVDLVGLASTAAIRRRHAHRDATAPDPDDAIDLRDDDRELVDIR